VLQQWRKPHTLVISPEGALLDANGNVDRLVDMQSAASINPASWSQVLNELDKISVRRITKPIRFVVANQYVRYAMLPWQADIYSQQDWQSLAENHMRLLHGNVVDTWKVSIAMQGYGNPLIISAIDDVLLIQLHELAAEKKWIIDTIEPAVVSIVNHYHNALIGEAWLMVIEPKRATLVEMYNNIITRFTVACPPESQEQTEAVKLVKRALKSKNKENSVRVFTLGESALVADFKDPEIKVSSLSLSKNTDKTASIGEMLAGLL